MPDAPRWLDPHAAAEYVGITSDAFRRRVKAGKLPAPSHALGPRNPRWDRAALDAAMSRAAPSSGRPLSGAIHAILAEGRTKAQAALRR
jgi:predicted DNA-binding transcriptional regulator AlpA